MIGLSQKVFVDNLEFLFSEQDLSVFLLLTPKCNNQA